MIWLGVWLKELKAEQFLPEGVVVELWWLDLVPQEEKAEEEEEV